MDKESQIIFDEIVAMDQDALTIEQKGFLMARRSYLNDEQRKRYADMIKLHEDGKLIPREEEEVALADMTLKELKAEAKARKVDIAGLKTEKEIIKAIENALDEDEE